MCDESKSSKNNDHAMQIKLHGNGSLVVFAGDAYSNYCHCIKDRVSAFKEFAGSTCVNAVEGEAVSRGHRISITFRHKFLN